MVDEVVVAVAVAVVVVVVVVVVVGVVVVWVPGFGVWCFLLDILWYEHVKTM